MNRIALPLGDRELLFPLPEKWQWDLWQAGDPDVPAGIPLGAIGPALHEEAQRTRPARKRKGAAREAAVVVPDLTRPAPLAEVLDPLLDALGKTGVLRERCRLVVATGTHRRPGEDELWRHWGGGRNLRVVAHDADAPGVSLGRTAAGTPVELNPEYVRADLRITVGAVSFHYFAGYGGGPKLIFPGVASRPGIRENHRLALAELPPGGLSRACGPGVLQGNPVAADIVDAAAMCPAHIGLHLVQTTSGWRGFVGERGLEEARRALSQRGVRGPAGAYDVVVASAGGSPHDIDLVQAHKALVHAARYGREGAAIILLAATPRGAGSESFARWLAIEDLAALERRARLRYELNAQTAISIRMLIARHRVIWLGSQTPEWVERAGAVVVNSGEEAWRQVEQPGFAAGRGVVLPQATAVIPDEFWAEQGDTR